MRTRLPVVVISLILATLAPGLLATGHAAAIPTGVTAQGPFATQAAVDPDAVLLAVALHADGSATWRVEYRVRLDDQNTTQAFESLAADVETSPDSFTGPFRERMAGTVSAAEDATGREMAIRNVTVSAERRQLPQAYGVLVYRFEWTGFAAVDGSTVRAGDALAGLFLDQETALLVSWPDGYRIVTIRPEPDEQRDLSVVWRGPLEFAAGQPRVVIAAAHTTATTTGTDGGGEAGSGGGGQADGSPPILATAAVVVIAILAAGTWYRFRQRGHETDGTGGPADVQDGSGGGPSPPDGPSEELLRNDERVLALLEEHGGRMKQQAVASALDWTDAKTSQVVSDLRESGRIESFRLGRENVLTLPHVDIEPVDDDEAD